MEHIYPSSLNFQHWSDRITQFFAEHGSGPFQAKAQTFGWIGQSIMTQASLLAYLDVFWGAAIFTALMVPVTLSLKNVSLSGNSPAGH